MSTRPGFKRPGLTIPARRVRVAWLDLDADRHPAARSDSRDSRASLAVLLRTGMASQPP